MTRTAYHRTLLLAALLAALGGSIPARVADASQWGSSYGDPFGFCAEQSRLPASYGVVVTNDPSVPTNPERDTFWGWHSNPGYDDWYGYFYGDFRGRPGDDSGWMRLMTVAYGNTGHWNFGDYGWAVHGHAKQYIAYQNWTFAGGCGFRGRDQYLPPPYMADVIGSPVTDIYVDSVPPYTPQPYATAVWPDSVSFAWPAVSDRGDGAGGDYFVSGLDHYSSWLTVDGGGPLQSSDSFQPAPLRGVGLRPGQSVCAHVAATDRLGNRSPDGVACVQTPTQPAPTLIVGPVAEPAPVPTLIVGPVPQYRPVQPHQPVPTLIVGPVPQYQPVPTLVVGPVPQPQLPPPPASVAPSPPPIPFLQDLSIGVNPRPGLVGLPAWFWLAPDLAAAKVERTVGGVRYRIETTPLAVRWDFGDRTVVTIQGQDGIGRAYPAESPVAHVYQAHDRWGYRVHASVSVRVTWSALVAGAWQGPFDLAVPELRASTQYAVQQAQPEIEP